MERVLNTILPSVYQARCRRRAHLYASERAQLDHRLLAAAYQGDEVALEWLLQQGAEPNARDVAGSTGLLLTSHVNCARILLKGHANPEKCNNLGIVPLLWHIQEGNQGIADVILSYLPSVEESIRLAALEIAKQAAQRGATHTGDWAERRLGQPRTQPNSSAEFTIK